MPKVFICKECGSSDECILHVPEHTDAPLGCPYICSVAGVKWQAMIVEGVQE